MEIATGQDRFDTRWPCCATVVRCQGEPLRAAQMSVAVFLGEQRVDNAGTGNFRIGEAFLAPLVEE